MQSIYLLIKISSILKIKTYLELKTQMHLKLLPSLGCDTGASHTTVLWSRVTQVQVQFQKSDRLGHRYAHTSYEVFVPWTLYWALMHALPQVAEVFCVHLLHTSYFSVPPVSSTSTQYYDIIYLQIIFLGMVWISNHSCEITVE